MFPRFISLFSHTLGTLTRAAIGSSNPRFQSVNTFQARKRNVFKSQTGSTRKAFKGRPRKSKIIAVSCELRAIAEEREFSGKFLKSL